MAKRSFYVKDSELDDYQVKVINKKTDNSYIVKGCAGSGKSILALWKAKQIQDEHKGTYLYIVFTKALMQYMADGISQVGIPQKMLIIIGIGRIEQDVQVLIISLLMKHRISRKKISNCSALKQRRHYCCMAIRLNNYILLLKTNKQFQWRTFSILLSFLLSSLCSIIDYQRR